MVENVWFGQGDSAAAHDMENTEEMAKNACRQYKRMEKERSVLRGDDGSINVQTPEEQAKVAARIARFGAVADPYTDGGGPGGGRCMECHRGAVGDVEQFSTVGVFRDSDDLDDQRHTSPKQRNIDTTPTATIARACTIIHTIIHTTAAAAAAAAAAMCAVSCTPRGHDGGEGYVLCRGVWE